MIINKSNFYVITFQLVFVKDQYHLHTNDCTIIFTNPSAIIDSINVVPIDTDSAYYRTCSSFIINCTCMGAK